MITCYTHNIDTEIIDEIMESYRYFGRKIHMFNTITRIQRIVFFTIFSSYDFSIIVATIRRGLRQHNTNSTKNSFVSYLQNCYELSSFKIGIHFQIERCTAR